MGNKLPVVKKRGKNGGVLPPFPPCCFFFQLFIRCRFLTRTPVVFIYSEYYNKCCCLRYVAEHSCGTKIWREYVFLVDSKEPGSVCNGVEQPFTSYYFSCGESPWEGKLEGEYDNIEADDGSVELETSNSSNSKTQEMVRQLYFHCIFLHYQDLRTI